MKAPKGSLARLIRTQFCVELDSSEFYEVLAHTLSYLTKGISYSVYQERLKPFCRKKDFSAKDFRLMLHEKEYLGLSVKLFIYRLGKLRSASRDDARALQEEYKLFVADAKMIYRFWTEQRKFRVRIKKMVAKFDSATHLNREVLRNALGVVFAPVQKYIKRKAYKKLRFICRSQNLDLADLQADLTIKAMNAYYKLMPCRLEPLHVVNYLKRSVHNAAINIIHANTSQKAGRLVNERTSQGNDAFSLVVVSENQMQLSAERDPVSYEELAAVDPISQVEIQHSISKLVSNVPVGGKKHRFLTILMGVEDSGFTEWLRTGGYCTARETNAELQGRVDSTRFNILLGRFLRVDERRVDRFISTLRTSLGGERVAESDFAEAA